MAVLWMWIMLALTLLCVVLRFYTGVFVIQSHGPDDHAYNFAFVSIETLLALSILHSNSILSILIHRRSVCFAIPSSLLSPPDMASARVR